MKPYRIEKLHNGTIEYRKIQAWECREYDGEPSNWKQGTPDGDRWLIEKKVHTERWNKPTIYKLLGKVND